MTEFKFAVLLKQRQTKPLEKVTSEICTFTERDQIVHIFSV